MEKGYIHGSDMLVGLMLEDAFTPMGHSKTCTISNKAETKERAVKPTLETKAAASSAAALVLELPMSIPRDNFICLSPL